MILDDAVSAVVTGGASGLGEAIARALRTKRVKVAIFDLQVARGEALAAEIGADFREVDVTSDAAVERGFIGARAVNGQERILVNCAGTASAAKTASRSKGGDIRHFPLAAFDRVIQINLVGSFRCIAQSAAGMLTLTLPTSVERGVIVNTASIAAQDGQAGQAAYAASKAAIVGMTLPIARDLAGEAIRINTILPGIFDTPLMNAAPPPLQEALAASIPFPKRFGIPSEYASMVIAMLENSYLNGECVRLDGAVRLGTG